MKIFKQIKSSVYGPAFYRSMHEKSLGSAFKYFFSLIAIVALVCAGISLFYIPKITAFGQDAAQKIIAHYPSELEVKVAKGQASSNVPEPYFIPLPSENAKSVENSPKNLLVIDTKDSFNLSDFNSYSTAVLLSKDVLAYKDKQGKITIQSLDKFPDVTVNQAKVVEWAGVANAFLAKLVYFLPLAVFFGVFVMYVVGKLVYLLFVSLLVMLLLKTKNLPASYSQAYKMSLHAITVPIVLGLLMALVGIHQFLFLPTIILLVVLTLNLRSSTS